MSRKGMLAVFFTLYGFLVLVPGGVLVWLSLEAFGGETALKATVRERARTRLRDVHHDLIRIVRDTEAVESERPYFHYQTAILPEEFIGTAPSYVPSPLVEGTSNVIAKDYYQFFGNGGQVVPFSTCSPIGEKEKTNLYVNLVANLQEQAKQTNGKQAKRQRPASKHDRGLISSGGWSQPIRNVAQSRDFYNLNVFPEETIKEIQEAKSGKASYQKKLEAKARKIESYQNRQRAQVQNISGSSNNRQKIWDSVQDFSQSNAASGAQGESAQPVQTGVQVMLPNSAPDSVEGQVTIQVHGFQYAPVGDRVFAVRAVETPDGAALQGYELDLTKVRERIPPSAENVEIKLVHRAAIKADDLVLDWMSMEPYLPDYYLKALEIDSNYYESQTVVGRRLLIGTGSVLGLVATMGLALLFLLVRGRLELAQRRSGFVSAVTHELKAPLTGIRALAELLATNMVTDPEKASEYHHHILSESERLSRLVHNVLDFARIEQHERVYDMRPVAVNEIVEEAARAMSHNLENKGLKLQLLVSDDLMDVAMDRDAIVQCLVNLLDNAGKYAVSGETIELIAEPVTSGIRFKVVDHGPGIPVREAENIFDRFHRLSNPEHAGTGGAGLGLTIVREHAEAHKATVAVTETPGGGATFELTIPG